MALSFKKNIVVGVSVTPERGLEVAQVDFSTRTILKYGCKPLVYDNNRREIADLDIFKETLSELFTELDIPKGSEVALNLPTVYFKVADFPASLALEEVQSAIEEELVEHIIFQNTEAALSTVVLPNSTIQFNKVACEASQKVVLIELAMQIKDLGYKLINIDSSVNSTLNALIYNDRVDVAPDTSWVLLLVDNNCCRIIPMQGRNYVDCFEERISIGEVLGDEENCSTIVNAVNPILKNLPSQRLYVVSKTDIISAKMLANKLVYNAQIIHQEDNCFNSESYIEIAETVNCDEPNLISLDVIGAAIQKDFVQHSNAKFNLFNKSLGDVFLLDQPPVLKIGSTSYELTLENMLVLSLVFVIIIIIITLLVIVPINQTLDLKKTKLKRVEMDISTIEQFLSENKNVSSEMFDEGDEIRMGLVHNKGIYTYYTIVGTEIPQKLWLTYLSLGKYTVIEGQADNLESVYSFYRNIKDYNPESSVKLQKLGLASSSISNLSDVESMDKDAIITSMNADYYEFRISDAPESEINKKKETTEVSTNSKSTSKKSGKNKKLPKLEPLE